jgi:LPS-assembly lipoprotein
MSSSDRRRFGRLAVALLLALPACNFKPIYRGEEGRVVVPDLAAIDVVQLYGRRGQFMRGYLLDEFNPEGVQVPAAYRLNVVLRQESNNLAIQLDNTPTRVNLALGAVFTLSRIADGQVLYDSATRRVVSYNVRGDPFATLAAEQDAERRAAREVARQIRTILSLYFADRAT